MDSDKMFKPLDGEAEDEGGGANRINMRYRYRKTICHHQGSNNCTSYCKARTLTASIPPRPFLKQIFYVQIFVFLPVNQVN